VADLDTRRRASQLELSPDAFRRLVYDPLGIRFDQSLIEVEWAFWSAATSWTVEMGARQVLDFLQDRQVPCAVLSNTMVRSETVSSRRPPMS